MKKIQAFFLAAGMVLSIQSASAADLNVAAGNGAAERWPFIVIRHTSAIIGRPDVFKSLIDCHRRYRGVCDEFWFSAGSRGTPDAVAKSCEGMASFRPLCDEVGVKLSYQQGMTLGHGASHDGKPKPDEQKFPEDAWQMDQKGKRMHIFCPRSPDVLAYEREYAKAVIKTANPSSYWLDDDLRLGISKPRGCFCDRCIAAFNAKTGGKWTRETLVAKLFSNSAREPVRAAWLDFNAESLAVYAAAVRQAADELGSPCRLAYQSVWADTVYTGSSFRPLLETLSGADRKGVGIRPGAGYYVEAEPRGMVKKCLSVAREAERCRTYGGIVKSICYEQETYPRHVLHKSPGAIMTECAVALASGCDSLSLYWYSASAPEPIEEYDRFLGTLSKARPYFERLAASARRTRLGGVARFLGSAALEAPGFDLRDKQDFDLACAGIPVTVAEANPSAWYLTETSRAALTDTDKAFLAKAPVVKVDDIERYPLASRRRKLLDDIDKVSGGMFPVRVDACRPLRILPRVREDGTLDSVTIVNLSIGDTDEFAVRVRRPVARTGFACGTKGGMRLIKLEPGATAYEAVARISNLAGWEVVTLFFEETEPAWSSEWIDVTAANGVKDDAFPVQPEPEKSSFRFRVMRHKDNTIGVEAFVRDDRIVTDNSPEGSLSCKTWHDDCLEVFFDGDGDRNPNTRGPNWNKKPLPCNAGGEYAIAANGATQSDYASAKKCFGNLWYGFAEPWMKEGSRIGTHYRLWFSWECLNRPAPRPDESVPLRMTVCIHDDDDGDRCDYALYWKGNPKYPFADESAFDELVLGPVMFAK